jgi:phage terminase large subunit-like protein
MEYLVDKYIEGVLNNEITVCQYVKLAVERHVNDLEKSKGNDFKYYFDEAAARFAIDFFQFLKHSKGEWAGDPISLESWQQFIIACVFGWKQKEDKMRRFRVVYEEVARKNGKSTKLSGIGLYGLIADGEPGAEIYTAAVDKDQARIIWTESKRMVEKSDDIKQIVQAFANSLSVESTQSKFAPLSSETKNKDGLNVHLGLIDEYHEHPTDEMYNLLWSGSAARRQPLLWVITTAGFRKDSTCKREHDYAVQLLEGRREDDKYFAIIFTLDQDDDWEDPEVWVKSNPNLNVSVKEENLHEAFKTSRGRPSKINEFKTKRLNIWTTAYTRWILSEKWNMVKKDFHEQELSGRKCIAAIDLSSTIDISGYCLCFPSESPEENPKLVWRFFLPEAGLRERSLREDVPYDAWVEKGYVTLTPGDVIDYSYIEDSIKNDAEEFEILEIPHDPYNATQLINNLMDFGFDCFKFNQNIMSISPAAKSFETAVLSKTIDVQKNPVMDYMMGCAEVYSDANGNIKVIKPDRRSSSKRIDGVIMAIMAYHRAMIVKDKFTPSVYEKKELLVL